MLSAFLTRVRCVDVGAWEKAVIGQSNYIIANCPVPPMRRFRVYFGKKGLPSLDDCHHVFVCRGCAQLGRRRYAIRVEVVRPRTVI